MLDGDVSLFMVTNLRFKWKRMIKMIPFVESEFPDLVRGCLTSRFLLLPIHLVSPLFDEYKFQLLDIAIMVSLFYLQVGHWVGVVL